MRKLALLGCSVFLFSCKHGENCDNLQKIQRGMSVEEVTSVMKDQPDTILVNFFEKDQFSYLYPVPFGASQNVYINFSEKDSLVISAFG